MRLHRYATTNGWGYSAANDERSGSELIGGPRRPGEENGNRRSNQHCSTHSVGSAGIVHDLHRRPVEDLRYGSEQQVQALRGVNLRIQRNEYVAIMGPSGSGKSTLMNLIGCLDSPSKGNYWLNGQLVSELDDDELARIRNREIGFVFQTFNLLARATALHNVELPLIYAGMPAEERGQRAREALTSVGMEPPLHHKPNELSGGKCKRSTTQRASANRQAFLMTHKPSGNLDSRTRNEIMALMDR